MFSVPACCLQGIGIIQFHLMNTKLYTLSLIILLAFTDRTLAQTTGLSIYQPTFATQQAGWPNNGNSSFGTVNSATALILNPSTSYQVGSGIWNQKIPLPTNSSCSAFFPFQID